MVGETKEVPCPPPALCPKPGLYVCKCLCHGYEWIRDFKRDGYAYDGKNRKLLWDKYYNFHEVRLVFIDE